MPVTVLGLVALFALSVSAQTPPQISTDGVVSAGLSSPAVEILAPGAIASIFGTNFAAVGVARDLSAADIAQGTLPINLAGVCVQVNSQPAFLLNVRPGQINFQVPAIDVTQPASVQVIANCGQANAQSSNTVMVSTNAAVPEFFYFSHATAGDSPIAAVDATSGTLVGTGGTFTNSGPASPGDVVTLYATGFGAVSPSVAPGSLATSAASTVGNATVSIGGIALAATDILYAGVAPTYAGLYQLNIRIPSTIPNGFQPVEILIGNSVSAAGASLQISNPAVTTPCVLPAVTYFSADPFLLTAAGPVDLTWATDGATSVSFSPSVNSTALIGDQTISVAATTTFVLTAKNACGAVTANLPVPLGTPVVSAVAQATLHPVAVPSISAKAGSVIPLAQGAAATMQIGVDPKQVTGVVFTSPSGTQLMTDVVGIDGSGTIYFRVPYLAEMAGAAAPVTYMVGALVNGQVIPGLSISVAPLTYSGDALGDFKTQADAYFAGLLSALQGYTQSPQLAPAVPILSGGVSAYQSAVDAMIASLQSGGVAQVPVDLPSSDNPSPQMLTVHTADVAGILAYQSNFALGSSVLDPSTAAPASSGQTPSFDTTLRPRDSSGPCFASYLPFIPPCLVADQAANGLPGQALAAITTYSTAASAVAPTVAGPVAAGAGLMSGAGDLTIGLCKLLSIWLKGFTIYPKYPNALRLSPVPDDPQMVTVFANLGSGDFGANVLNYVEDKAVNGALSKLPIADPVAAGRIAGNVKLQNGYVKDKLTQAQNAIPSSPSAPDTVQVGACDLQNFYAQHGSKIVEKAGAKQGTPNYYFLGKKKNSRDTMNIVPFLSHFLIDGSVRKKVDAAVQASQPPFTGTLAVGQARALLPTTTIQLTGEGSIQSNVTGMLAYNGDAIPPNSDVSDSIFAEGAVAYVEIADLGDDGSNSTYDIHVSDAGSLSSITGAGSLSYYDSQTSLGLEIHHQQAEPNLAIQVEPVGSCSITGTISTATQNMPVSGPSTFAAILGDGAAARVNLGIKAVPAVGASCRVRLKIRESAEPDDT